MNREEAIKELQESHDMMRSYDIDSSESRLMTPLNMAIKALEQEPCGDAIDRKLVCAFIAGLISDDGEREKGLEYIRSMPSVTPQPSISQPDIEAIRQEIETEMNLCRMKDTVSKGYKGKILEEVLGKIDKYIQKPQEKWIDEDDNRYICKECEYAHKPQKEPCEDAISRAEAVRVASGYCHPANVAKELAKLPPVSHQETVTEFADRCRECGREKVLDKIRAEIKTMSGDIETIADVLKIIDKHKT